MPDEYDYDNLKKDLKKNDPSLTETQIEKIVALLSDRCTYCYGTTPCYCMRDD